MTKKQSSTLKVFLTIIAGIITYLMANSFATTSYVDRHLARVEKQHNLSVGRIERMIKRLDKRVYDMWIKIPRGGQNE